MSSVVLQDFMGPTDEGKWRAFVLNIETGDVAEKWLSDYASYEHLKTAGYGSRLRKVDRPLPLSFAAVRERAVRIWLDDKEWVVDKSMMISIDQRFPLISKFVMFTGNQEILNFHYVPYMGDDWPDSDMLEYIKSTVACDSQKGFAYLWSRSAAGCLGDLLKTGVTVEMLERVDDPFYTSHDAQSE